MKLFTIIFLLSITISLAQKISGYVLDDSNKKPLAGASISIKNSNFGTYTNSDGFFQIKGFKSDSVSLLVSMLSYKKKEIVITDFNGTVKVFLSEQPLKTSEIIVSANKRVQTVQEIPITVSVIDKRELDLRNITQTEEAIRFVPGVEVNQDNISIRGSSGFSFGIGSRALLLVDGFPLVSGDNGDVSFDALPLYNIERIEVVKGAGSALYGTSALGGVINIITTDPKPKGELKARIFSGVYTKPRYQEWDYSDYYHHSSGINANYSKKISDFGFNIGGSYLQDQSYQNYRDEEKFSLNSKFNYDFNDFTTLSLTSNINYTDRADWVYWKSLEEATKPPEETNTDIRIKSKDIAVYSNLRHIFNDNHFMNFKAGILKTEFNNTHQKDNSEYRQSVADNINFELQMNSNITSNTMLTYGLNYLNNSVDSYTYGNQFQQIFSGYSQIEYTGIDRVILNIGGRLDFEKANEISGDLQLSPKLGMSYRLNEYSGLRLSGGTGFRAPTVAERFASVSFQGFDVIQNVNLLPERSLSIEVGYNFENEISGVPFYLDYSLFNNEFYDLIEPGFVNEGSTIQFQNLTRATIFGTELNIKSFLFGFLGLETALTYLNPINVETDEILKYRSEIVWYSRLLFQYQDFTINSDYRYKSKVKNIDNRLALQIKNSEARVPVHVVDLSISYNLENTFNIPAKMSLFAKNIFDYYYTEVPGNLAPVRYIGFQINYKTN